MSPVCRSKQVSSRPLIQTSVIPDPDPGSMVLRGDGPRVFARGDKSEGFALGDKSEGFALGDKSEGFALGDKSEGFALVTKLKVSPDAMRRVFP